LGTLVGFLLILLILFLLTTFPLAMVILPFILPLSVFFFTRRACLLGEAVPDHPWSRWGLGLAVPLFLAAVPLGFFFSEISKNSSFPASASIEERNQWAVQNLGDCYTPAIDFVMKSPIIERAVGS